MRSITVMSREEELIADVIEYVYAQKFLWNTTLCYCVMTILWVIDRICICLAITSCMWYYAQYFNGLDDLVAGLRSLSRHLSLEAYKRLISASKASVSISGGWPLGFMSVSAIYVLCPRRVVHTTYARSKLLYLGYVCSIRHCSPVVNNHVNMTMGNEREK